jgi:hypothetical protein
VWGEERAQAYVFAVAGKEDGWRGWHQLQGHPGGATLPPAGWPRCRASAGTKGRRW